MQAFVIQGIVIYVKDISDKTEWCILPMKPIWNESPILRSLDVKLVKLWTVLASDQQSYIISKMYMLTHWGGDKIAAIFSDDSF